MKMLEKTSKTISTIAILWAVKAIFEKRTATVEVDSFVSPVLTNHLWPRPVDDDVAQSQ